jgi:hypothetical protein
MLRAALVGLPSSGKTTLFQLMTSIHDAPKGKGDVNIGISKVPDERLDSYRDVQPEKARPATVEFTDHAGAGRSGRRHSSTSPATRTPTRWCTSCAVRDPSFPIRRLNRSRAIAQDDGDELIWRISASQSASRTIEKDLKGENRRTQKERDLVQRCKEALEHGTPLRALQLAGDDLKRCAASVPFREALLAGDQPDETTRRRRRRCSARGGKDWAHLVSRPTRRRVLSRSAQKSSWRSRSLARTMRRRSSPISD